MSVLISPVNVSEGRRLDIVGRLAETAARFCFLLDVHSDRDHNRSIVTIAGEAAPLIEGILAVAGAAMETIDLNEHTGVHPRIGSIDVVPFVEDFASLGSSQPGEAIRASYACASRIWKELQIPCFLFEQSAVRNEPGPLPLSALRTGAFGELLPDFGAGSPHPTAGAVAVGARPLLVAYNMNLDSTDLQSARRIARALRERFEFVRAMGFPLASRGCVQVSCNLLRPNVTTMQHVFEAVTEMAAEDGTAVLESEVAGLASKESFGALSPSSLKFSTQPKILEDCIKKIA